VKTLVVGASSFVGRHTLELARLRGDSIGTQCRSNSPDLLRLDLASDRITSAVPKTFFDGEPPWCIVCASVVPMDRCASDPEYARRVMVDHTIRLIQDVRARGGRAAFVSTGFVFDGLDGYYNEEDPCCPVSAYGRNKADAESIILAEAPDALIVRLDKVVGDDPSEQHLFTEWFRAASAARPIECFEGQIFAPTFVGDVAASIVTACELGLSGIYHVANPEFFARDELARQFFRGIGISAQIVRRPENTFRLPEGRALKSYLDSTRFVRRTGFRFSTVSEIIRSFKAKAGIA
jgi:dTDP-4-dehydrorhamnose reductase